MPASGGSSGNTTGGSGGSVGGTSGAGGGSGGTPAAGGAAGDASSATELIIPDCPGPSEHCDSERCVPGEPCLQCGEGQVCVEVNISCGPAGGISAQCVEDPCAGAELDCSCASAVCDGTQGMFVFDLTCGVYTQDHFLVGPGRDPFMSCSGGGICASPDTQIATPSGERPIADLQPGDLVYSRDRDQTVIVPVLTVTRRPVHDHHVVRLELSGGSFLEISGPHPTGDGRRLEELSAGDDLDGRSVLSTKLVQYGHSHTYDILPASESGDYVANGVWMGTTLSRAALVACQ